MRQARWGVVVLLGFIGATSLRAEGPQPRVAPSVWTHAEESKLAPSAIFSPPEGLIERVLVARELEGGSLDQTPELRMWMSQARIGITCGAKETEKGWVLTGCAGPWLDGPISLETGPEPLMIREVVAPVISQTETGYDWSARERFTLAGGKTFEIGLSGSVAVAREGKPHRLSVRWEGPLGK